MFEKGLTKMAGGPSQIENAKVDSVSFVSCWIVILHLWDHSKLILFSHIIVFPKRRFCLSSPNTAMDNSVVVSNYVTMDLILHDEQKHILNMTVLLCGLNELVLVEANWSVHDAQCVVRSLVK